MDNDNLNITLKCNTDDIESNCNKLYIQTTLCATLIKWKLHVERMKKDAHNEIENDRSREILTGCKYVI